MKQIISFSYINYLSVMNNILYGINNKSNNYLVNMDHFIFKHFH